jgi:excisionase family DNA binding protein
MKTINSGSHQVPSSESRQLTTSEAAELCSVKSDTVLKWVKKGRLRAVRTAGGHHRIEYRDLESFLWAHRVGGEAQPANGPTARPVRCWEFFSNEGVLRDACKECVVYRVRAAWCFEMVGLGKEIGHAKLFCQNSCEDCAYYRRVKGLKINVLVVSQDGDLIRRLAGEENEGLSLRVVHNSYEASAAIHDFRPAFAVVDRDLIPGGVKELVECLTADSRVPGLKIILAVPDVGRRRRKDSEMGAVAVLVKPFGPDQVTAVVNRLPVESVVAKLPL